jgi:hypothetical protein
MSMYQKRTGGTFYEATLFFAYKTDSHHVKMAISLKSTARRLELSLQEDQLEEDIL